PRERAEVRKSQLQQDTDRPEPRGKKRERREPALVGPVLLHLYSARRSAIDIANRTEDVLLVCGGIEPAARRYHGGLPDPVGHDVAELSIAIGPDEKNAARLRPGSVRRSIANGLSMLDDASMRSAMRRPGYDTCRSATVVNGSASASMKGGTPAMKNSNAAWRRSDAGDQRCRKRAGSATRWPRCLESRTVRTVRVSS